MRTIKNLVLVIIAISLFLITSCSDDTIEIPQNTHDDAYGDVILKKVTMMGIQKYKLVFFAGGLDIIAEDSKVTYPDGTELALESFWASGKLRSMAAPMSIEKPMRGEFTFTLKFSDDYIKTVTDFLEDTEVDLPMPLVVDYTPGNNSMTVSWNAVDNTDLYCIKITDLDILAAKPLFKVGKIETNQTSITINFDGGNGWMRPMSDLVLGTNYWISVAAKKVEEGKPISGMSKNFQTSACLKTQFTY